MNLFFLLFFSFIGILGIIYKVDAGVFVGFGLAPWQLIRMRKSRKLNLLAIIITGLAGSIYFISIKNWVLCVLFIFIELYNHWGNNQTKTKE